MIFLDINTFYYASDGGIKTFYDAKIDWFKSHPEHFYYLAFPGPKYNVEQVAPNVQKFQVFGIKDLIGKGRRLMLDYGKVLKLIRFVKPDIVELGDPLLSPFAGLLAWRTGMFNGVLSSFHHSDPLNTYIYPWAYGEHSNIFKRLAARLSTAIYLSNHRRIPYSVVASRALKQKLGDMGIGNIHVKPFGVQEIFAKQSRLRSNEEKRILFAGRLEFEKGIYLVKKVIPRLLKIDGVRVTVMGKGTHENFFKNFKHPSFEYKGFVSDRDEVASIYSQHTIFLAPGPYETFGIGVLEALVNGMIIVGPDQGGTGEILSSMDSPFLFEANNTEAFYNTILKALTCDMERESVRSLDKSEDFNSWETAIGHIIDFYIAESVSLGEAKKKINEQESPDFAA